MITVRVTHVSIPPMSTVGFGEGFGFGECGQMFHVHFVGDHRPMRNLGLALAATSPGDEPPVAVVPDHAVISALPVKEGLA